MAINRARFTINGTPSEDPVTGDRGYDAVAGEDLELTLEMNPARVLSVTYELPNAAIAGSPQESINTLPQLFTQNSLSSITLTNPNDSVNVVVDPATEISTYMVRCTVVHAGGTDVFERAVAVRQLGLRMTLPAERQEYSGRSWSDALNELALVMLTLGVGAAVPPPADPGNNGSILYGDSGLYTLSAAPTATGQVMIWNDATEVWAPGAVDLANPNSVTGVLPAASGGTGLTLVNPTDDNKMLYISAGALQKSTTVKSDGTYLAVGTSPAAAGSLRLSSAGTVQFRNNANSANLQALTSNSSDVVIVGTDSGVAGVQLRTATGSMLFAIGGATEYSFSASSLDMAQNQLLNVSLVTVGATPASAGTVRFTNTNSLIWRNNANSADISGLAVNASDIITMGGGAALGMTLNLASGNYTFQHAGVTSALIDATTIRLPLGGTVATSGTMRVSNGFTLFTRDNANTANFNVLSANSDDTVRIGSDTTVAAVHLRTATGSLRGFIGGTEVVSFSTTLADLTTLNMRLGGATWATAGTIRLNNANTLQWRDAGNTANLAGIQVTSSDNLLLGQTTGILNIIHRAVTLHQWEVGGTTVMTVRAAGEVRLGTNSANGAMLNVPNNVSIIEARNAANSADITVASVNGSDQVIFGGNAALGVFYDVASANVHTFRVNSVVQATLSATALDLASNFITSLADPVNPQDGATKAYVDLKTGGGIPTPANPADDGKMLYAAAGVWTQTSTVKSDGSSVRTGANPSTTGVLRLSNADAINWRNAANGADLAGITMNASDQVVLGGTTGVTGVRLEVATGGFHLVRFNGVTEYSFSETAFSMTANVIQFNTAQTAALLNTTHNVTFWNGRNNANNANVLLMRWGVSAADELAIGATAVTALHLDVATGAATNIRVNGANEYTFNSTTADWQGNSLTNALSGAFSSFVSIGASAAAAGALRLANNTNISWRNAANSADVVGVLVNTSNVLVLGADAQVAGAELRMASGTFTIFGAATAEYVFSSTTLDGNQNTLTDWASIALGASPATAGTARLTYGDSIQFRDFAGAANSFGMAYGVDGNDILRLGDNTINAGIQLRTKTGGSVALYVNNVLEYTFDSAGLDGNQNSLTDWSLISLGATPSTTGAVRLSNNTTISWRNAANSADAIGLQFGATDILVLGEATNVASVRISAAGNIALRPTAAGSDEYTFSSTSLLLASGNVIQFNTAVSAGLLNFGHNSTVMVGRNNAAAADVNILRWGTVVTDGLFIGEAGVSEISYRAATQHLFDIGTTREYTFTATTFDGNQNSLTDWGYIELGTGTMATTGLIRTASNSTIIRTRNAGNTANISVLDVNASDQVILGGTTAADMYFDIATAGDFNWRVNGTIEYTLNSSTFDGNQNSLTDWAFIELGATPADTGSVRLTNNTGIFWRNAAASGNVRGLRVDTGDIVIVGDSTAGGVDLEAATGTTVRFRINGTTEYSFTATTLVIGASNLIEFNAADTTASIYQDDTTGATDTTVRTLRLKGQDKSGTTSVVAGNVALVAGYATGASGTRVGGSIWLGAGTGATQGGNVYIGPSDPAAFNYQGMGGGTVFANGTSAPSAPSSAAAFLYVSTGSPTWYLNVNEAWSLNINSVLEYTLSASGFDGNQNGLDDWGYIELGGGTVATSGLPAGLIRVATDRTIITSRNAGGTVNYALFTINSSDQIMIGNTSVGVPDIIFGVTTGGSFDFYINGVVEYLLDGTTFDGNQNTLTDWASIALGASPATSGAVRLTNNEFIKQKVSGGTTVTLIGINDSDIISIGSSTATILGIILSSGASTTTSIAIGGTTEYTFSSTALDGNQNSLTDWSLIELGATPATGAGQVRSTLGTVLTSRNNANSADLGLIATNTSDQLIIGSSNSGTLLVASMMVQVATGGTIALRVNNVAEFVFDATTLDCNQNSITDASLIELGGGTMPAAGLIRFATNKTVMVGKSSAGAGPIDVTIMDWSSTDILTLGSTGVVGHVYNTKTASTYTWQVNTVAAMSLSSTAITLTLGGTAAAGAGSMRVANAFTMNGRNAANSADIGMVQLDGSNQLNLGGATGTYPAHMLLNVATSGLVNIVNNGATYYSFGTTGIVIKNVSGSPSTPAAGTGVLYVEGEILKYKNPSGLVTELA